MSHEVRKAVWIVLKAEGPCICDSVPLEKTLGKGKTLTGVRCLRHSPLCVIASPPETGWCEDSFLFQRRRS